MEVESDDDVDEQAKNSSDAKAEGKFESEKRLCTIMKLVVMKRKESALTKKIKKTQDGHENQRKNDENDQALVSNEMTLSSIGNDIFIGDSAATSHMTNNLY